MVGLVIDKQWCTFCDWPGEADELDCSALESSSICSLEAGEKLFQTLSQISASDLSAAGDTEAVISHRGGFA